MGSMGSIVTESAISLFVSFAVKESLKDHVQDAIQEICRRFREIPGREWFHRHWVNNFVFVSLLVKESWKDHTQEAVCIYTPGCNLRNMPSILRDHREGMGG
jgi:hypothetical protein